MPRDIIENSIQGKVDYQWDGKFKSLREEVHFFTDKYPWTQFGIDFALGAKADDVADLKTQQFAPDILMESFSKAVIHYDTNKTRPLIIETLHPANIDPAQIKKSWAFPGPVLVMWLIFIIVLILSWLGLKNKKPYILIDMILFTVAGIIGVLIAFLVFVSEHPTTEINYLLLWLHPLYILYLPALLFPSFRKIHSYVFLAANAPLQLFALAGSLLFLPQSMHPAAYPLLLILMTRSVTNWFYYKNNA